jgi:cytochrome bd-type quinol oxidase subunit 2
MYTGLLHLHHWLPFVYLLLMLVVLVQNFLAWKSDNAFTDKLARQNRIALILTHLQVTIGLIMLFGFNMDMFSEMGSLMKDSAMRFKYVEHPLTMIIAAVLITVGNAKSKRGTDDASKAKPIVIWFGIGLFLIALRLPWEAFLQGA